MKTFRELFEDDEAGGLKQLPWNGHPDIGWHEDHPKDHMVMYHGTHESNLGKVAKHGLQAPKEGPTAGWVSMTHDPQTAHGYAAMSGGESSYRATTKPKTSFRAAGNKRVATVPHEERAVLVAHIPREFAKQHMANFMKNHTPDTTTKLTDKAGYEAHKAAGGTDHEHYFKTERRFDHIPPHFIKGFMKRGPMKPTVR